MSAGPARSSFHPKYDMKPRCALLYTAGHRHVPCSRHQSEQSADCAPLWSECPGTDCTLFPPPTQEELYRIDRIGPRAMAGFVVGILAVIFIFGLVDFVQALTA